MADVKWFDGDIEKAGYQARVYDKLAGPHHQVCELLEAYRSLKFEHDVLCTTSLQIEARLRGADSAYTKGYNDGWSEGFDEASSK